MGNTVSSKLVVPPTATEWRGWQKSIKDSRYDTIGGGVIPGNDNYNKSKYGLTWARWNELRRAAEDVYGMDWRDVKRGEFDKWFAAHGGRAGLGRAFAGLMDGVSDGVVDAFDYIMNTEPAYKKLGEAVCAFERKWHGHLGVQPTSWMLQQDRDHLSAFSDKWRKLTWRAIQLARIDYKKNFSRSEPGYKERYLFSPSLTVFDIMKVALQHRDRFT